MRETGERWSIGEWAGNASLLNTLFCESVVMTDQETYTWSPYEAALSNYLLMRDNVRNNMHCHCQITGQWSSARILCLNFDHQHIPSSVCSEKLTRQES